ncbi:MAG: fumarylacetoacetate hydrolase family protein, partial [Pirellulales bacterium]|nr:fumarylacetoacetate hydrolase family protein [Pirellulales bacterium]
MRYVRFKNSDGQVSHGAINENLIDVLDDNLQSTGNQVDLTDVSLLAPVVPSNIFCIGLNYREHAKEGGAPIPEQPVVFMKPTSTLLNPGEPILIPACGDKEGEVDYECELAVVIG